MFLTIDLSRNAANALGLTAFRFGAALLHGLVHLGKRGGAFHIAEFRLFKFSVHSLFSDLAPQFAAF